MDGVVHGSGNQVLEHLAVLAHDGGLDLHPLHLVPAAHHDLDHPAAGLAGDFNVGDLGLGLLHVGLHGLGLLHQIVEIASHRGRTPEGAARRCAQLVPHFTGRTVSGSSVAPKRSRKPCTPASASSARRAESNSCCVARCSTCAGVSTPGAAVSNSKRTLSPKWRDSACASLSSCAAMRTSLLRGSSARRTTAPCRPMNTQLLASWRARPDSSSWLTSDAHEPATASWPGIAGPAPGASPRCSPEVATGTTPGETAAAPTARAGLARPPLAPGARAWLASLPGRNAIILSRVISNPVRGSGASARSRLPMIAV